LTETTNEKYRLPQGDRLFVALEVPEDVKTNLNGLQADFPGLKWTPSNNLHLTLRFIGQVPPTSVEPIQSSLRRVKSRFFRLVFTRLGLFKHKTGDILWAGVSNEPSLLKLKQQVDETLCVSAGLSLKSETFSPHLTLSRLKKSTSPEFTTKVQAKAIEQFGEFTVTGFTLFRSFLRPSGAIHESVERYTLSTI
jgi:2'-5' RNA ligase